MLRKNISGQFIHFAGVKASDGTALTGATFSYRRCIDGTFAAGGGTITEDAGLGFYKVALAQADTNGNDLGFFFTATSAVPVAINVITTAADPTDTVRFGLTALPNAAAGANTGLPVVGTQIPNATAAAIGGLLTAPTTANVGIADLSRILGTALTETTGQIAAAFKKFFDKATPTGTINSLPDAVAGAAGGVQIAGSNAATTYATLTSTGAFSINGTSNVAQTGDSYARLGVPAGASLAADTAAVKADTAAVKLKTDNLPSDPADASDIAASFSAVNSTLTTIATYIDTEVAAIKAKTDSLTFTAAGQVDANALAINSSTNAAANLARGTLGTTLGTVGSASTTTSIVTSALDPAASVADQYKGRIVTFDRATTTAALRGQATDITASTSGGVLTVTALTTAPASGDTFTIT